MTGSAALGSEGGGVGVGRVVVVVVDVVVVDVVVVVVVVVVVDVVVVAATVEVVDVAVTTTSSSFKNTTATTTTMRVTAPRANVERRDIAISLPSTQAIPLPRECRQLYTQEFRSLDTTNRQAGGDVAGGHRLQQLVRRDGVGIG